MTEFLLIVIVTCFVCILVLSAKGYDGEIVVQYKSKYSPFTITKQSDGTYNILRYQSFSGYAPPPSQWFVVEHSIPTLADAERLIVIKSEEWDSWKNLVKQAEQSIQKNKVVI
jgi:hypothetical protein